MYRIPINYKCFIGLRKINQTMRDFKLFEDKQGAGVTGTVTITMNLPEIPSKEQISEVGKIYVEEFNRLAESEDKDFEILFFDFDSFGMIEKVEQ